MKRAAAAKRQEEAPAPQPKGFKVTVSDRGRIVLPAEVREELKIKDGEWLTLILEPDGVIKLLTGKVWTDEFLKIMRHFMRNVPPGRRLSDELIAERRAEAAKEQREVEEWLARRAKKKR